MKFEVIYKGERMYITKMDNGYFSAQHAVLSLSRIGQDLEKLIEEFGEYIVDLNNRFRGQK